VKSQSTNHSGSKRNHKNKNKAAKRPTQTNSQNKTKKPLSYRSTMDIENWRIFIFSLQQEAGSNEEEEELVNKEAEERKKEKSLVTWQQQTNATAEDGRKNTKKSAKLTTTELCTQRQTRERKRRERERERERILPRSCLP